MRDKNELPKTPKSAMADRKTDGTLSENGFRSIKNAKQTLQ